MLDPWRYAGKLRWIRVAADPHPWKIRPIAELETKVPPPTVAENTPASSEIVTREVLQRRERLSQMRAEIESLVPVDAGRSRIAC